MVVLLAGSDICCRIEQENTVDGIILSFALHFCRLCALTLTSAEMVQGRYP